MNEYKVMFSYIDTDGRRRTEEDTALAFTSYEAGEIVEREYSDLEDLRIEEIWIDRNNRWELVESWKI